MSTRSSAASAVHQADRLQTGLSADVKIHPFINDNGRWFRMLANPWLRKHGAKPTLWPEPLIGDVSPIRSEYIEAIQAADRNDHRPLIELHRQNTHA